VDDLEGVAAVDGDDGLAGAAVVGGAAFDGELLL
jgi:hypothetical protein